MKEARSLVRDEKAFIKVVFKEKNVQAKESVAVDISSMAEIVVGKTMSITIGSQPALMRYTTGSH